MSAEERIAQLEREMSFVARLIFLREAGHATPEEITRLREIAGRVRRGTSVLVDPHNATP